MGDLLHVQNTVADHLDDIKKLFKPGAKITVLVRAANDPEGLKDFMMGDDSAQEAMNMVARRMAADSAPARTSQTAWVTAQEPAPTQIPREPK